MHTNETSIYTAVLTGLAVFVTLLIFFVVTIIRYQRKKVAISRQKIKEDFKYLDKERERIAFDLHDDIGASLSTVKLRLQCLSDLNAENATEVQNCENLIDTIMQKLRQISFHMMPGVLQRKGLDHALRELLDVMTFSTGIEANYTSDVAVLDKERSIHIYRIAQEILNNIVKYSQASLVNFTLAKTKNTIELRITDNGIGFNKNEVIKESGKLGLHTIAARTELLNAKIYLTTAPGKGVDYLIEMPEL